MIDQASKIKIIKFIFNYFIGYVSYCFLTGYVIFIFTALMIILITATNGNLSFMNEIFKIPQFYQYIVNRFGQQGEITIGIKEVMRGYLYFSLIVAVVFEMFKHILKKVFSKEFKIGFKQRIKYHFLFISIIYLAVIFTVPFMKMQDGSLQSGMYSVIAFFYFGTIFSAFNYLIIDSFRKFVVGSMSRVEGLK